jgi:murein DD-endopeptidase MepM/ murein hydrolase activator NlpD
MACNCGGPPKGYELASYDSSAIPAPEANTTSRPIGTGSNNTLPQQPGECTEAYLGRVDGNPQGGDEYPNTIANGSLAFSCDWTINQQMLLTTNSDQTAVSWSMSPDPGWFKNPDGTLNTVAYNNFLNTGKIEGSVVRTPGKPKIFKITVSVVLSNDNTTSADFTVIAQDCVSGDALRLNHPLPGSVITSRFGPRQPPTGGASSDHKGCDFAFNGGLVKDVLASADGTVLPFGDFTGHAGNYVQVEHRNAVGKKLCETRYLHLETIYVQPHQKVSAGQPIGKEGNSGIGTGKHLHFEVRGPHGECWDPMVYIQGSLVADPHNSSDPGVPAGSASQVPNNSNTAITSAKGNNSCANS